MEDMVKMLADAPENQRKMMLMERFKMIAGQPEDQRVESVKGILMAISKLDASKKKVFIRTRTDALIETSEDNRKKVLVARVKAGGQVPEDVNKMDILLTLNYTMQWPKEKLDMFMAGIKAAYEATGMTMPDVKSMMEKAKSM